MDFSLCGSRIRVDQTAMTVDFALMGLYEEYTECSAEAGSPQQEVGFFGDILNGRGELNDIEQYLATLHGCISAKITEVVGRLYCCCGCRYCSCFM
jgi:hypothetical protein